MKKVLIKQVSDMGDMYVSMFLSRTEEELNDIYNKLNDIGYDVVAECYSNLAVDETLYECYKYFNIQHDDVKLSDIEYKCSIEDNTRNMHSLSIGDIVQIDKDSYLCASNGWHLIREGI